MALCLWGISAHWLLFLLNGAFQHRPSFGHMTHWTVTGKLRKWCCQHRDINKAKDRLMWPRPRFLVSQGPFNSNTLIYKRLTVVIFDPMGFWGGGVQSWKLVTLLGAWLTLLTLTCRRWPVVGAAAESRCWLDCACQRPPMFMKTTNAERRLHMPVGPDKLLDFGQAFSLYQMASPISCPSRQKPRGTLNSVCLGQEIPPSTLREYSAQRGTNDLSDLMFLMLSLDF